MKVKDLIEHLKSCSPDAEVTVYNANDDNNVVSSLHEELPYKRQYRKATPVKEYTEDGVDYYTSKMEWVESDEPVYSPHPPMDSSYHKYKPDPISPNRVVLFLKYTA